MAVRSDWPPDALIQIGKLPRSVVLQWKTPLLGKSVARYLIQDFTGAITRLVNGAAKHVFIEKLDPDTPYRFVVSADTDQGWTDTTPFAWARTAKDPNAVAAKWTREVDYQAKQEWEALSIFLHSIDQIRLLAADEEIQLMKTIEVGGAEGAEAFQTVELANLRLVVHIARRYRRVVAGSAVDFADLIQEGYFGLRRSIEKFDWRLGNRFSTYATWWIRQTITRAIAEAVHTVRLPVHAHDKAWKARGLLRAMDADQDTPSWSEVKAIALELGEDPKHLQWLLGRYVQPLDLLGEVRALDSERTIDDFAWGDDSAWIDAALSVNESPDGHTIWPTSEMSTAHREPRWIALDSDFDEIDNLAVLSPVLATLAHDDPRTYEIVVRRYGLHGGQSETLQSVGERVDLTRERVRQLEKKALATIRESLGSMTFSD